MRGGGKVNRQVKPAAAEDEDVAERAGRMGSVASAGRMAFAAADRVAVGTGGRGAGAGGGGGGTTTAMIAAEWGRGGRRAEGRTREERGKREEGESEEEEKEDAVGGRR